MHEYTGFEIFLFIKPNAIPCGQRHYHMEFCLVISLTMGGNWAVTWPPIIATRYISFATTLKGYCTVSSLFPEISLIKRYLREKQIAENPIKKFKP